MSERDQQEEIPVHIKILESPHQKIDAADHNASLTYEKERGHIVQAVVKEYDDAVREYHQEANAERRKLEAIKDPAARHAATQKANAIIELKAKKVQHLKNAYRDIQWIYGTFQNKPSFTAADSNPAFKGPELRTKLPLTVMGGGLLWLEPFLKGTEPTNNVSHGHFLQVYEPPQIVGVCWREYKPDNSGAVLQADAPKKFGNRVQLHIYTRGLYGQDLEVLIADSDDDELPPLERKGGIPLNMGPQDEAPKKVKARFTREVKIYRLNADLQFPENAQSWMIVNGTKQTAEYVQKAVIDIFLDPFWQKEPFGDSETLTIHPCIRLPDGTNITTLKDGTRLRKQVTLRVEGTDREDPGMKESGNMPVLVGQVPTDAKVFHPCRYLRITIHDGKKDSTFFDSNDPDAPRSGQLPIELVGGGKRNKRHVVFEVQELKTDLCTRATSHKDHVIDISDLQKEYAVAPDTPATESPAKKESAVEWKTEHKDLFGVSRSKSRKPNDAETANNGLTVTANSVGFDAWYDYGPMDSFRDVIKYFWLPSLDASMIKHIRFATQTCAYQHRVDIAIYPDIKWTLQIGFNVTKAQMAEAFKTKPSFVPTLFKKVQDYADEKNIATKALDKHDDDRDALTKIRYEQGKRVEKRLPKEDDKGKTLEEAPNEDTPPQEKGNFANLLKLLGKMKFSLGAEWQDDTERSLEISKETVEMYYDNLKNVFEVVKKITSMFEGTMEREENPDKDPKKLLEKYTNKKGVRKLLAALDKKPTDYVVLYPKIVLAASWQYKEIDGEKYPQYKNRQGLELDLKIACSPFIGISITWHFLELLCRRHPIAYAVLKAVESVMYLLGDDESGISVDFIVTGSIALTADWRHNLLAGNNVVKADGKGTLQAKLMVGFKLQGKKQLIANSFIVYDLGLGAGTDAGGGAIVTTGADDTGIYMEVTFSFEGIKVKFHFEGKLEFKKKKKDRQGREVEETLAGDGYSIDGEVVFLNQKFKMDKIYLRRFN